MRNVVFKLMLVMLLLFGTAVLNAQTIESIEIYKMDNLLVDADFDADGGNGDGHLRWHDGLAATVETDNGSHNFFIKVNGNLKDVDDLSSGGQAKAVFGDMNLSIMLFEFGQPKVDGMHLGIVNVSLSNAGPIYGYREVEDGTGVPSTLSGKAFVDVSIQNNGGNSDKNYIWADTNVSGMTTNTASIKDAFGVFADLTDYSSDWSSGNVTITLSTDESIAIPEPATLGLLSLGGLLFVRRRKNA